MAHEIVIPRLGWSMEEGTFISWLKKDGDPVQRGEAIFELEGEKALQEIEAVDEGILRISDTGPVKGSIVKVGAVIGYLVAVGKRTPSAINASMLLRNEAERKQTDSDIGVQPMVVQSQNGDLRHDEKHAAVASPRARRVALELGIDWKGLSGTGAGGRVRESDVRAAAGKGQRLPLSSRRRVIAQRMLASRQLTVPVTITTKADATSLVNLRDRIRSVESPSPLPSYQDIITKLVAEAIKQHPLLAGRWEENAITVPAENQLHLGMAVDTADGLVVAVIRNAGELTVAEIAKQSRRLVERAQAGKLNASEMQGAVFTITNLGAFGIDFFTPTINSPETAILGIGAIRREPFVLDDGSIVARYQLTLSLTFDHRVIDGAPAARFLQTVVQLIATVVG